MNMIESLNKMGVDKRLRPAGMLALRWATSLSFATLCRLAGRHMVSAFAAAPAIIMAGYTVEDALHDADLLYKAMRLTVEKMGFDTFCLTADLSLEAEACGCNVSFSKTNLPTVVSHIVDESGDANKLNIPDPNRDGRMPVFLKTIKLIKKNYTMIKVAAVTGPFTLAGHLIGTQIYLDVKRNPEKLKSVLDFSLMVAKRYARDLVQAGADMILLAEPSSSQISPKDFETFSLPYTKEFIATLGKPCILHICGKTEHILGMMCESGAAALSVEQVDMRKAVNTVPRQTVLIGNISPTSLAMDTVETIKSQTLALLDVVKARKEFVVAPGCDLSSNTPVENIRSFVETAKNYSAR
jgi:uroporphyrinogen decarboxylase